MVFPGDVPFLKEHNGDLTTSVSQGMRMFSFTSDLPFTELTNFYLKGIKDNGWVLLNEVTQGKTRMWYFGKTETRIVILTLNPYQQKTMISNMISPIN